jgi:hypothetical protein
MRNISSGSEFALVSRRDLTVRRQKVTFGWMNFYDVYTTLSLNPVATESLNTICQFLNCRNELELVKQALWQRPARLQSPGAFPFDDQTGRIYDSLWKAAAAENYSKLERFGRWLFRTVCPPADDEGMAAFHRKAKPTGPDEPPKPARREESPGDEPDLPRPLEAEEEVQNDEDLGKDIVPTRSADQDAVVRRSTRKD